MAQLDLSPHAQHWVNVVLIWVGLGALAGLLAKAFLPLRHPSGPVPTLVLGICGSMAGLLALSTLLGQQRFNPISPVGFLGATAGAFVLMIAYRVLRAVLYGRGKDAGR